MSLSLPLWPFLFEELGHAGLALPLHGATDQGTDTRDTLTLKPVTKHTLRNDGHWTGKHTITNNQGQVG